MKFWLTSLLFISELAYAQLDPASGLLLNSDPKSSNRTNGLDSGRYTVRPHNEAAGPDRKKFPQSKSIDRKNETNEVEDESKEPITESPVPTASPIPVEEKIPEKNSAANLVSSPETPAGPRASGVPVQSPQRISPVDYKKNNIVEMSIAPTFIHNHSSSELSFRNYSTSNLAYYLDVAAWLQTNFALHGQLISGLSGSVNDSYDHSRNANLTQQWISVGFRYRDFLSNQKNASSLSFGIDYEDYQFQVDSDSRIRNRLETSGAKLSLLAEIPQSSKYSWEVGVDVMPKAKHLESLTNASLQSGGSPTADVMGISIGGRIYFNSANQMFWRISERLEKDQYLGPSSKVDPATNQTFTNVSVTNSFTMIQIGYTWGN